MNPAPDADLHSVGQANFDWIVKEVADLAIAKANAAPEVLELRWAAFLGGAVVKTATAAKKAVVKKQPVVKNVKRAEKKGLEKSVATEIAEAVDAVATEPNA